MRGWPAGSAGAITNAESPLIRAAQPLHNLRQQQSHHHHQHQHHQEAGAAAAEASSNPNNLVDPRAIMAWSETFYNPAIDSLLGSGPVTKQT